MTSLLMNYSTNLGGHNKIQYYIKTKINTKYYAFEIYILA